jgi:hypothetical protein
VIKDLSFLDLSPKKKATKWVPVKVVFIGGENYPLISLDAEAHIEFVPGGFETKFRDPVAVPSELLLGSSFRKTKIFDIELRLPGFTMSLARMHPKKFPRQVYAGEMVGING